MIKMLKTAAGPAGSWVQNGSYTLAAETEAALVAAGAAEYVGAPPAADPEPVAEPVEVAVTPEPENATKRTTRPRRRAGG